MNHSYNKKSFDSCQFNPMADEKMLAAYPKLFEIAKQELAEEELFDEIMRYTIMVYDPKSPLVSGERDLNYRKGIAAELAGFDMEDEELMTRIYMCAHPIMPELITSYLMRFAKSKEFAAICAVEYKFWESIRKMLEPITGKNTREELDAVQKKSMIAEEIDKDIARLDSYYKKFFGEDDELERRAKKRISPELMADRK